MEEYVSIGYFVGVHGLNGELVLKHELGKKTAFKDLQFVFLEEPKGKWLPYFISAAKARSVEETGVSLEGIMTREAAKRFNGKKVWLRQEDFDRFRAKSAPISLIGYLLKDSQRELGRIDEIIEQPFQLLCRLLIDGKEVLIPLNESTLKKIDHTRRQVLVDLPDGLLEVYLT
jgi:16S rRNA processing protein RimM